MFQTVQKGLANPQTEEYTRGAAIHASVVKEFIFNCCADCGVDLLNPKPEQLELLADMLRFLVREGMLAAVAMEQHKSIKH